MIYDMAIVRVDGGFCNSYKLLCILFGNPKLRIINTRLFRVIWNHRCRLGEGLSIKAREFKVYYCYDKSDKDVIDAWRDKYDRKNKRR